MEFEFQFHGGISIWGRSVPGTGERLLARLNGLSPVPGTLALAFANLPPVDTHPKISRVYIYLGAQRSS